MKVGNIFCMFGSWLEVGKEHYSNKMNNKIKNISLIRNIRKDEIKSLWQSVSILFIPYVLALCIGVYIFVGCIHIFFFCS